MSDQPSFVETLIERLPYADGTGRRRFVSGGLFVLFLFLILKYYLPETSTFFNQFDFDDIFSKPTIFIFGVLIVYAIGNLVELVSDYFFLRAAAGMASGWANFRGRHALKMSEIRTNKRKISFLLYFLIIPFIYIFQIVNGLFSGLFGRDVYRLNLKKGLSKGAMKFYKELPDRIKEGIKFPVGNSSELSFHYLTNGFSKIEDVNWAKKQINRTKDIGSITTTVLLIVALTFIGDLYKKQLGLEAQRKERIYAVSEEDESVFKESILSIYQRTEDFVQVDMDLLTNSEMPVFLSFLVDNQGILKNGVEFGELSTNQRLGEIKKFLNELETKIEAVIKGASNQSQDQLSSLKELVSLADEALVRVQKRHNWTDKLLLLIVLLLSILPFSLLYAGYFLSLKNSVKSIIEGLYLKREEDGLYDK